MRNEHSMEWRPAPYKWTSSSSSSYHTVIMHHWAIETMHHYVVKWDSCPSQSTGRCILKKLTFSRCILPNTKEGKGWQVPQNRRQRESRFGHI
jgi:hypothetical protein